MELDADLLQIEEQSFRRAFFTDGLLDLCAGIFLLGWAIAAFGGAAGMGGVGFAVLFPVYLSLRKKITEPRVGVVKFGNQRIRRQRSLKVLAFGFFTFTAALGLIMFMVFTKDGEPPSESSRRLAPLPMGVIFALMYAVGGFKYDVQRAFAYAMWTVVCFVITVFVNEDLPFDDLALALGLSSILPLVTGQVMLVKFMRRYPRA
jgi:hypothetical protein